MTTLMDNSMVAQNTCTPLASAAVRRPLQAGHTNSAPSPPSPLSSATIDGEISAGAGPAGSATRRVSSPGSSLSSTT